MKVYNELSHAYIYIGVNAFLSDIKDLQRCVSPKCGLVRHKMLIFMDNAKKQIIN
jgi:hypothetical protein